MSDRTEYYAVHIVSEHSARVATFPTSTAAIRYAENVAQLRWAQHVEVLAVPNDLVVGFTSMSNNPNIRVVWLAKLTTPQK